MKKIQHQSGLSIIEIVLAVSIFSIFFFSTNGFFIEALALSKNTTEHIQASYLNEEGIEILRAFRNQGWNTYVKPLSTTTTYYLKWSAPFWVATTTPQRVDNTFIRTFVVRDVQRDAGTSDIVASSGVFDPNTKKIIMTVEWNKQKFGTSTESIENYLSNLFSN